MRIGKSLDEIGKKYNTDKASTFMHENETFYGHDYLRFYELFLQTFKKTKFTLVELGCFTGASLRMWKEYFSKVKVVGVDLDSSLESLKKEKIDFICSDATASDLPAKLSIYSDIYCIIDDGSHAWGDQRRSFEMLFPILNSGGYYIIEDLECGAEGAYPEIPPKVQDSQVFWDYAMDRMRILRVSENRNREDYRPFYYQLPKYIQELESSIDMALLVPGSIVFRKK